MSTLIALWAPANSGKTTTLKIVRKHLAKVATSTVASASIDGIDFREIFIINGKKVGIESQGDPGSRLCKSLELFKREGCSVIICSTRSRGSTVKSVEALEPDYKLSWRGQSAIGLPENRGASNQAIAKLIYQEARDAIAA